MSKPDMVNHPPHYTSHPSGIECIDITRHMSFSRGNALKYLWRKGLKQSEGKGSIEKQIEDLNKALFYIEDERVRLCKMGGFRTLMHKLFTYRTRVKRAKRIAKWYKPVLARAMTIIMTEPHCISNSRPYIQEEIRCLKLEKGRLEG